MVDANTEKPRPTEPQTPISLADKLAQIKAEQIRKEQEQQNILLTPIREKIEDLNQDIFKMDFVMSSMDGGPFAERIKSEPDNKFKNIQTMVDANKELLISLGVSEAKDLIDNPNFTDTQEILEYKQAQKNKEAFESIDPLEIQKKFKELGIEIENPEEISHDIIAEKLKVKREEIEEKILIEKIKIPECKEEVIEILSKKIEPNLLELVNFNKREIRELYKNDKQFLSKDILKLTEKFGQDIVREAIIKAYDIKVQKFIDKKYKEDIKNEELKKYFLEKNDPAKRESFLERHKQWIDTVDKFINLAEEKREKFKDSQHITAVKADNQYDNLSFKKSYGPWDDKDTKSPHLNKYSLEINYDDTNKLLEWKIDFLNKITEKFAGLNSQEDIEDWENYIKDNQENIKNYSRVSNLALPEIHPRITAFCDKSHQETRQEIEEGENKRKKEKENILKEIGILGTVIDIEILKHQFRKTRDSYQGKLDDISYDGLADQIKDRKNMVERTNEAIKYISNIEDTIPPQEIQLSMDYNNGCVIKVPSFKEETNLFFSEKIEPLQEIIEKTKKEIEDRYQKIGMNKFPLGIGRKKCEEEKNELESFRKNKQEECDKLWKTQLELKKKEEVKINLPYIGNIYSLIKNVLDKNVNSKDFFDELKKETNRIKEQNTEPVPEELIELNKKYKTLNQTI